MIIINVASEINPYVKTGGLADVVGSFPKKLKEMGHDVYLFMPLYKEVQEKIDPEFVTDYCIEYAGKKRMVIYKKYEHYKGLNVFFIGEHSYFYRDSIYGNYPDNAERFGFFSKMVMEFLKKNDIKPDIIHCHDWQTGLLPVYAKKDDYFKNTKIGFTIHNLAYQGLFNFDKLYDVELDSSYFTYDKLEFFGMGSMIKAGIIFSDFINTVSPTYRDETLTYEYGNGLNGCLKSVKQKYYGILNGIDYSEWNPEEDSILEYKYSKDSIANKYLNKQKIVENAGLIYKKEIPLFVTITRLAEQKGIELIIQAAKDIVEKNGYLIVLGSGEKSYENDLIKLERKFSDNIKVYLQYDFALSHRLYAAADFFLMPSRFEPCGLSQLISFAYGTIPVVRKTGGLADSVIDYIEDKENGNGFSFEDFNIESFLKSIKHSFDVYSSGNFETLVKKVMELDFSWDRTAREYVELYNKR